jgi:hypothetical protein
VDEHGGRVSDASSGGIVAAMSASTPVGEPAESISPEHAQYAGRRGPARVWRPRALAISSNRELAAVLVVLLGLAAIAFGSHVLHGGYYLDDWRSLDLSQHLGGGGISDSFSRQWDYSGFRPVSSVYRSLIWSSPLGPHLRWNLAAVLVAASAMSVLLFAVLRTLRFSRLDAGLIAALVLVCPLADSTRLWVSASLASANIGLYLIGLLCAIRGLRATSVRSQIVWHGAAAVAYLASVLFAESTAALIVATGLLYWVLGGFRAALVRTPIDAALAVTAGLWISAHDDLTPRSATSLGELWSRASMIARETPAIFERTADPFAASGWVALLALLALGAAAAVVVLRRLADERRHELTIWLAVAVAGLVVTATAWVIYLPADAYYRPEQAGIGNRINSLAAIGLVLIVYAVVRVVAILAAPRGSSGPIVATALTGLLAVVLLVGYVRESRADARNWDAAFASELATLSFVTSSVPNPPPHSMIYVVRQVQYQTSEVPIFVAWDFQPALRFAYGGAPGLRAWAIPWSVPFHCKAGRIYPREWGWSELQGAPYGNVWMIDVATRGVWHVTDRASCLTAADAVLQLPMARWVESIPNYPDSG